MAELPHKVTFGPVDKSSVGLLKIIHRNLLPVHYSNDTYETIKEGINAKGILAYYNDDTAVGEICYRKEEVDGVKKMYILTIGVLPTYQRQGIATMLINKALEDIKDVTEVYLHVHVDNEKAIQFYTKLGFTNTSRVEGYYKSFENKDAYLFSKKINQ
ncbi:acetyltransferase, GNAT family protein [Histomonas meleagridis]|uniref:acetyltransferase, GNAT family protein n=1 Tax=Histomonas meleagridis TaxID=135588 RepID=UPI00355947F6|nr:acetyltransferase, GNAT family protein [Histomonas meleagridis]KAH0797818.1 acetyltransferase, GNAT family protein [Histomonas meleagridis]